ncbi:hypothetical protein R3D73_003362 [Serratia marcescens]|uniref:hypothetical protein n=1 Tax=Serratia ureilytica TaxID=300181 RepID=UPI00293888DE|nr:hypothetical protein [Serratia marcescens]ELQ9440189.1 hypothetical protein [Serratia marcescens]ELT5561510.1 hypothetical protein [Serratia marcescens]
MSDDLESSREKSLKLQLLKKFEKVTPDLFSEFLYIKGVKVIHCLMCGSEDIGIPQHIAPKKMDCLADDEEMFFSYVSPVKVDSDGPRYSLMNYEYRVICRNCGFVSSFAAWPVVNWIEKKSVKGDVDGR